MASLVYEALGIAAGCMTTISFVPQVLHTYRSRSVEDISLRMYLLLTMGIFTWMVYGILIDSISVLAANGVSFLLTCSILVMKIRFKGLKKADACRKSLSSTE